MRAKTWSEAGLGGGRIVLAWLRLMRAHASLASASAVAVASILLDRSPFSSPALLSALAVALITGAGNTLNDYYDYEIDRINKPGRALPSGAMSLRSALYIAWLLFAGGMIAAAFLNFPAAAIAAGNSLLLIAYARRSKQWGLGKNLAVSYLVGSIFLFTACALGRWSVLLVLLSACSFLATLAREIVKDIEDSKGDQASHSRTLPLTLGVRKSYRAAFAMIASSLLLAVLPCALGLMGLPSMSFIAIGGLIFLYAFSVRSPSASHKYIMVGSLIELCAFLFARL